MGQIGKVRDLEYQNLNIRNHLQYLNIEKSHIDWFKIFPFRMEKFEINELMQNETFLQKSVLEMSHFDIIKAKNLI